MDSPWTSGLRPQLKEKSHKKGLNLDDETLTAAESSTLEKAFTCRQCKELAIHCEEAADIGPGACSFLHCADKKAQRGNVLAGVFV